MSHYTDQYVILNPNCIVRVCAEMCCKYCVVWFSWTPIPQFGRLKMLNTSAMPSAEKAHSPPKSIAVGKSVWMRPLNGFVSAFHRPDNVYVADACQCLLNRFCTPVCSAWYADRPRCAFIETMPQSG